jgi:hypothetical protein
LPDARVLLGTFHDSLSAEFARDSTSEKRYGLRSTWRPGGSSYRSTARLSAPAGLPLLDSAFTTPARLRLEFGPAIVEGFPGRYVGDDIGIRKLN